MEKIQAMTSYLAQDKIYESSATTLLGDVDTQVTASPEFGQNRHQASW